MTSTKTVIDDRDPELVSMSDRASAKTIIGAHDLEATLAASATPTLVDPEAAGEGAESGTEALGRGDTVGRHVIVTELGKGGMGVVYSAYAARVG